MSEYLEILNMFPGGGGGTEIPLDAPANLVAAGGNAEANITWTDPGDKYATPSGETSESGDQLVSQWAYTRLVRKQGSAPTGPNDGTPVVEITTRNQYQSTPYNDTNLTNDATYYYAAYAYNTEGVVSPGAISDPVVPKSFDPILENNSWEQIRGVSDSGTGASIWSIGDTHSLTINGQVGTQTFNNYTTYIFIIGFNHNSAVEGEGITFQGFKSAGSGGRDLCLVGPNYNNYTSTSGDFNMNTSDTNSGGWNNCNMRKYTLGSDNASSPRANTLMAALPADLRAVLRPMTIWTNNSRGTTNTASATTDYLPLLSEFEVFGTTTYSCSAEAQHQQQYAYYVSGNSKVKYRHDNTGSVASWWERSPSSGGAGIFCRVSAGGGAYDDSAYGSFGVAPALRM